MTGLELHRVSQPRQIFNGEKSSTTHLWGVIPTPPTIAGCETR